jgi:peptidoglycan/LPS O-acetylase OafA/YrhL
MEQSVAPPLSDCSCASASAGILDPYSDVVKTDHLNSGTDVIPSRESRNGVMDGWRGVSVLFVVTSHLLTHRFDYSASEVGGASENAILVARLAEKGGLFGVTIFFVISGILISSILLRQEDHGQSICLRQFYLRRAFRILPALLFYILAVSVLAQLGYIYIHALNFIPACTLVCNAIPCHWYFGHLWTLSTEEQFYLIWPLLLLAFRGARVVFARLVCALALLFSGLLLIDIHVPTGTGFACIGLGSLYAIDPKFKSFVQRNVSSRVTIASFILLFCQAAIVPTPMTKMFSGVVSPVAAFLILTETLREGSRLGRIVSWPVLKRIGLMSYSIYLWQQLFTANPRLYAGDTVLLFFPLLFFAGWLSFRLIERPFVQLGHALTPPRDDEEPEPKALHLRSI